MAIPISRAKETVEIRIKQELYYGGGLNEQGLMQSARAECGQYPGLCMIQHFTISASRGAGAALPII